MSFNIHNNNPTEFVSVHLQYTKKSKWAYYCDTVSVYSYRVSCRLHYQLNVYFAHVVTAPNMHLPRQHRPHIPVLGLRVTCDKLGLAIMFPIFRPSHVVWHGMRDRLHCHCKHVVLHIMS